ncbi:MAG: (d)CMP kinase [Actinomycetota bacterium]|nr:(d)CMP kinase [Actinomycetota bacterium]
MTKAGVVGVVIAVDGPSGSGKSTTARGVALRLGLRYLDTGAMYRALTWAMLRRGVDVDDATAVTAVAADVVIEPGTDPVAPTITADGVDVAVPIRGPAVTRAVSSVSAVPAVRAALVELQRRIIGSGDIVVEGRDIGSVVAPEAQLKIFLVADATARAARRTAELGGSNDLVASTQQDMERRDRLDSSRPASPLRRAVDAVVVDTTDMTLDEVVAHVVALVPAGSATTEGVAP